MSGYLWPTYYKRTHPPQPDGKPATVHEWVEGGLVWTLFAGWSHWSINGREIGTARPLVQWFSTVKWGLKPSGLDMGDLMDDLLKKALVAQNHAVPSGPPKPSGFLAKCPYIWAFLTTVFIEKGKPARKTSTILVFFEQGTFKTCLSDRENNRVAWGSGDSLEACLEGLEASLADGTCEWRPARQWGKK